MNMLKTMTAIGLCAMAGAAYGQCSVVRYGVPDFDQKRVGLEDDGAYHCVPTSCVNWMAYIANHGQPQAMGGSGNWQSQANYNYVTNRINEMGSMMSTNSWFSSGTDMEGALDGLVEWCDERNVGPLLLWGKVADDEWAPTPKKYRAYMLSGALVDIIFGRWYWDGGEWERDGGHAMSLVKVNNLCSGQPQIGFKNPSNNSSKSTQAPFETGTWTIYPKTADWDGDYNTRWTPDQSGEPRRVLDKVIVIYPLFCLTGVDGAAPALQKVRASFLNNDDGEKRQTITPPDGASIINAMHGVDLHNHLVLLDETASHKARLFNYDEDERKWTLIETFAETPRAMTTDRFGHAIVECDGSVLKYKYNSETGESSIMERIAVSSTIAALCVDDKTDDIYGLSASQRKLVRFPGGALTADHITSAIPSNIPLSGALNLAFDPVEGRPWIGSEGTNMLYQLAYGAPNNTWVTDETLNVGNGAKPRGLQIGDAGRLAVIVDGGISEFERDATGRRYQAEDNPTFGGIPAQGFLFMARSRLSYDRVQHQDPRWLDIPDYADDTIEVVDCLADYNVDDFVNGDDFDLFVTDFENGDPDADVNFDTFVNGDDFDLFVVHFEEGC